MRRLLNGFAVAMICLFTSCLSTHDVIPVSSDTYLVKVEDHGGIFAFNRGKMKGEALKRAKAFADSKNMDVVPVEIKEHPVGILGDWASVEYQFRLVPKGHFKSKGGKLKREADFISENDYNINHSKPQNVDSYDRLIKLDDLKKRGIISEEEFKQEKQKILDN